MKYIKLCRYRAATPCFAACSPITGQAAATECHKTGGFMQRWEYLAATGPQRGLDAWLTERGADGWELAAASTRGEVSQYTVYIFKRPLRNHEPDPAPLGGDEQ